MDRKKTSVRDHIRQNITLGSAGRKRLPKGAAGIQLQESIALVEGRGLLAGDRTKAVHGRMPPKLVAAAMERTGITSTTLLVEVALAHLVASDDFGDWLLQQRGTVAADLDLDF